MKSSLLPLLLVASAALAEPPAADPAAPLGRLFNTAERRAKLDGMRERNIEPGTTRTESEVRLDGIVRTSDGRSTVWVNGVARTDRAAVTHLGEHSARIATGSGQSVELPVGGSIRMVADDQNR
ncbi:hypothetical protein GCM10025771_20520 [Niveibacterium umoris]|uniref:Uncharacterized protein n=1 Tax=Niveibacterium umoris TaxID=1193620 RepID=A0A840BMH1_9RHOO|nr:hypothetical protein [Niveibacterium umoris]MBB4012758.1 hypothetical protein [Niveibacterium umoris]